MESLLDKILCKDYLNLTIKEIILINKHKKIFGLGKELSKVIEKFKYDKNNDSYLNDSEVNEKKEVIEVLQKELLPRTIILENLSNVDLDEEGINSNFKSKFINNLRDLNNLQICKLIDRISYYFNKKKLNFFGRKSSGDGAYHQINKVISESLNLTLVFQIFGKQYPKYSNRYMHLPIAKFNKELLIEALNQYCVRYLYILEVIASTMSKLDSEQLEGKKGSFAIGKEIKHYLEIVKEDNVIVYSKNQPTTNYYTDDVEGDEDE